MGDKLSECTRHFLPVSALSNIITWVSGRVSKFYIISSDCLEKNLNLSSHVYYQHVMLTHVHMSFSVSILARLSRGFQFESQSSQRWF